jgi:hypothetical protein
MANQKVTERNGALLPESSAARRKLSAGDGTAGADKPEPSPIAQKVRNALYIGRGTGAVGASFNEPVEAFDSCSERDSAIKEWGICVGLAFAFAGADEPFLDGDEIAARAEGPAREAFLDLRPSTRVGRWRDGGYQLRGINSVSRWQRTREASRTL